LSAGRGEIAGAAPEPFARGRNDPVFALGIADAGAKHRIHHSQLRLNPDLGAFLPAYLAVIPNAAFRSGQGCPPCPYQRHRGIPT
jgi:hypothetical protein